MEDLCAKRVASIVYGGFDMECVWRMHFLPNRGGNCYAWTMFGGSLEHVQCIYTCND